MKRRDFLKTAGVGAAASAIAAPAIAQSAPELKWRLASSFPKSLDTFWGGAERFCKMVGELTDNKFQIQPFAAGEIVPGLQVNDAASNGTVEVAQTANYYYFGKDPTFALACAIPFGLNTRMQNAWMWQNGGNQMLNDFFKTYNLYGIPAGNTTCQMGGWFRKEIKTPADFNGVKMRISGFAGMVLTKLGLVPQQIAGGDIYPALEKGTIDAAEWVGPFDDEKLGFYKVAKYYYYPGWWEGGTVIHNMINLEKWNSLPKNYQAVLTAASQDTMVWMTSKYDDVNPAALKRLVAGGAVLKPFPLPVMEASLKAANEVYGELTAKNANFKKIYDSIAAYRAEQYQWWQVAEYGYDSFMIRERGKGWK